MVCNLHQQICLLFLFSLSCCFIFVLTLVVVVVIPLVFHMLLIVVFPHSRPDDSKGSAVGFWLICVCLGHGSVLRAILVDDPHLDLRQRSNTTVYVCLLAPQDAMTEQ